MVKIQERSDEFGSINPTDQVLMTRHLLEASLMGGSLFFVFLSVSASDFVGFFWFFLFFYICDGFGGVLRIGFFSNH